MSIYGVKGVPFRFKGTTNVESCKTSEEVMIAAGLNWDVAKCELVARMPGLSEDEDKQEGFTRGGDFYRDCPNAFAVYRTDHNIPLGIVKGRYNIVQNLDAFNFFDGAIGKDRALWQTAGCYGNGEKIFVSAKLPKTIMVNGSDPVDNYLVFTTTHDGSGGVKILFTPIRVVCENTLSAAIQSSPNYVSFRHTSSVHKNIDTASEIMGISQQRIDYVNEQYNFMAKVNMTDKKAKEVFASVILNDKEQDNLKATGHTIDGIINRNWSSIQDSGISMKKVNILSEMYNYYFSGPGQKETVGTGWGVYGAITGYYSNIDNATGIKRMDSLLFGDKSRKIEFAGNTIVENVFNS